NSGEGIFIGSFNPTITTNVQIRGNIIGLQANGTERLGNGRSGIVISASKQITVGGTTAADRNFISANRDNGIAFFCTAPLLGQACDAFPTDNVVIGNYIGTDKSGQLGLGNSNSGILLGGKGSNNRIGGPGAGEGNLISGNGLVGVYIFGDVNTGPSDNRV